MVLITYNHNKFAVLWCFTHARSRVTLSVFHSKNKSSNTSFFHALAGRGGRPAQLLVAWFAGSLDRARVRL